MGNESHRLPEGLYALCDDGLAENLPIIQKVYGLIEGGVKVIQLRLKRTNDASALPMVKHAVSLCRESNVVCLLNDRVDWALLTNADGVHLGQDDLPIEVARKLLGPHCLIGATVRNLDDIQKAKAQGADYAGLGPLFPTSTKKVNAEILGLAALEACVSNSPLPIVAIAGIDENNIEDVAACGVHGAAVGSALYRGRISQRAKLLAEAFLRGRNHAKTPNLR